jgi:hypothetical protein
MNFLTCTSSNQTGGVVDVVAWCDAIHNAVGRVEQLPDGQFNTTIAEAGPWVKGRVAEIIGVYKRAGNRLANNITILRRTDCLECGTSSINLCGYSNITERVVIKETRPEFATFEIKCGAEKLGQAEIRSILKNSGIFQTPIISMSLLTIIQMLF